MSRQLTTTRNRGAAMMELVMVLPLVLVILALLFYLGRMESRAQRTLMLARYEAWRAAESAPGPRRDEVHGNVQLNQLSMGGAAQRIESAEFGTGGSDWETEQAVEPLEMFIDAARAVSADAGLLAAMYMWSPNEQGVRARNSHGANRAFRVYHADAVADWVRIGKVWRPDDVAESASNPGSEPLVRRAYRTAGDWPYTSDWRASAERWQNVGGQGDLNHLRATRDAFFQDLDMFLDQIDGVTDTETNATSTQVPGGNLAGHIRGLYLRPLGYRGPDIFAH